MKIHASDVEVSSIGLNSQRCTGCNADVSGWSNHTVDDCLKALLARIVMLESALRTGASHAE